MSVLVDRADRERLSDDLDTTFFVEAGAGTGKTKELVSRVVALVARGRLNMPGLAAITFTTAAAAELRDRIRRELAQAALDFEHWDDEQRPRCREASRSVDLAHIETIHAFAGDLLRTFPLEAHLPPGFTVWDEMQRDRDFDERFRAWLYHDVPGSGRTAQRDAVAKVLMLGLQPERLKLLTQRLQEHYDLLAPESAWPGGDPEHPVAVANECGRDLRDLDDVLEYSRLRDEDELYRTVRSLDFTIQQLVSARTEPQAFEALLRYLLKKPNPWRSGPHNWDAHPIVVDPLLHIRTTIRAANTRIEATIATHRSAALADLLGYLAEFTLAYARDRKQRGVATFHDLLVWARDLLRDHPRVRTSAHQRIQHLFVDEFQDTDPLQAQLVAYLVAEPDLADECDWHALLRHLKPGKLFVVGDPKQSIYRFRRAEVAVYQLVYGAADQSGASTAKLAQTYRAVEPLVDWVNDYFGSVMVSDPGVQAGYARLASRPTIDGVLLEEDVCGVRMVGGVDDSKAGDRWTTEAVAVARLARKAVLEQWPVTEQIDGVWQVRPAAYRDICVLLPTRTNLRRLERAFEDNGVPYRMESGSLVVFTQEVRDLVACLRAIDDPTDQVALVAALRSPAYACSDVDLLRWVEAGGQLHYLRPGRVLDGPVGAAFTSLFDFHARRQERSAAATIEALLAQRALGLLALDHPRPREAVRRQRYVVAQARKLASAGDATLRGFVHWIETLRKNELYDAESAVPDSDEDAVRLMTVHGSKGLEFPIVILSGLGGGVRANDGVQLLANHAVGGLEARCTARVGPAFATGGFDGDREKKLEQAQQLRLLYVASTRAREHLVLSLFHSSKYGKASHAASICNRLSTMGPSGVRPTEISLADLAASPPAAHEGAPVPSASAVHTAADALAAHACAAAASAVDAAADRPAGHAAAHASAAAAGGAAAAARTGDAPDTVPGPAVHATPTAAEPSAVHAAADAPVGHQGAAAESGAAAGVRAGDAAAHASAASALHAAASAGHDGAAAADAPASDAAADTAPGISRPAPVAEPPPEAVSPEAHMAAEAAWQTQRQHLMDTLGHERLATPSGLAHEPEPPSLDTVVPADSAADTPSARAGKTRKAATNLGMAVHAVLEWLDLESLSNLDQLAAWSATENGVDGAEVARLARQAALSAPVRLAVASSRYWREVPISVSIEGVLLEGAIDLLYEDADGSLAVVDYKTDKVSPQTMLSRAEHYRIQGEAYALALRDGLGLHVTQIEFIFVAAGRDQAEVIAFQVGNLQAVAEAIARSP